MTKIAIDARESGTSTGRYVDKLIEYLYRLKPEYEIIILTKPHRIDFLKKIAPGFQVIESPYKEFTFDEQIAFKKQIAGLKADLVHFSIVQQPIFYRGKTITTMHDLTTVRFRNPAKNPVVFTAKQKVYIWLYKKAARKSSAIITPSRFVKDDIVKFSHVNPQKVTITHESADPITDKAEVLPSLKDKNFIMYIGRFLPHKNIDRLIDAFAKLQTASPDLYLALAGKIDKNSDGTLNANYQRVTDHIERLGIKDKVAWTDFVSEGQLRWMYQNCAAYIFPSLSEGFGLPGLEAMEHGAPVVSSSATCLPEVYGEAAHYFDPLDIDDMAAKISEVLDDEKLRKELVAKGKGQVKKYSWRRMAEQTLEAYRQVLGER